MARTWARHGSLTVAVAGTLLVTATGTSSGAPGDTRPAPSAVAADRDHDRVSDDLAPRLRSARSSDALDVIVTGLSAAQARAVAGGFAVRRDFSLIRGFAARLTAGQARALAADRRTLRVEGDRTAHVTDTATDADYGAAAARSAFGLTGAGVGICTIDTGVDPNHEQIAGRTVVFKDLIGTSSTAYDDHGHGTHVMSIAAGDGVGGGAAAAHKGVAPAAALYAVKALDSSGSGADSGIVTAVQWCAGQSGVRVISMSLGDSTPSDGNDALSQAVDAAADAGKVVVVAAGNAGDDTQTVPSPGAARKALTVGAASDHSAPVGAPYADAGVFLAPFSSRGPTVDGRVKPDVVGPGVTVEAAQAGTTGGYVTYSGTSMATPYVAGVVALGLQANPVATPTQVLDAMTATAEDWGPPGKDDDWGAGLVDAKAFVSRLLGGTDAGAAYPTHTRVTGSVPNNGSTTVPITVPSSGLGTPLSVTVTLAGQPVCYYGCLVVEWSPDLDVELLDPSGAVVDSSACALDDPCGIGRQETVTARPAVAGTYTLRVYAFTGSPNNGKGGSFSADVSQGPLVVGSAPPPPVNRAPVANAGPDQSLRAGRSPNTATFTLSGAGSSDPDGDALTYRWDQTSPALTTPVGTSSAVTLTRAPGTYVFRLTVNDGSLQSTDSVTVKIRKR
jgi:serine protease AprX